MSDKKRRTALNKAQKMELKKQRVLLSSTRKQILALLKEAQDNIKFILSSAPSDYQLWKLTELQRSVEITMIQLGNDASLMLGQSATQSWLNGIALVDSPLTTAGMRITSYLNDVNVQQLSAIRSFLTNKIKDVSVDVIARINANIGLTAIGSQSVSQTISNIATVFKKNARSRALTIVRTELNRLYSVAAQERQLQAAEILPGLKKKWRKSGKKHQRLFHSAANNQIQNVNEPFVIGGVSIMFPRDPKAPAKETINCGCVSLSHMERWESNIDGVKVDLAA